MTTPPPPPGWTPPAPQKKKGSGCAKFGCLGLFAIVVIIGIVSVAASKDSNNSTTASSGTTTTVTQTTQAAAPASPQTITYVVTGASDADIQYGPAGSNTQGHAPLHVTQPIGSSPAAYYSINAQLQGSGDVSCEIEINGKVISHGTASGGYNIASCEVMQDPLGGGWQDANAG
ncbi:MmpS family transport accessory protein [Streptacidiphilus sp. MAP5-3]|uniref:MmpS family transport accessory protein n=1 Tax=unclassified Streptacidiphilus TaxID=2643834 RepID=UPI0035197E69